MSEFCFSGRCRLRNDILTVAHQEILRYIDSRFWSNLSRGSVMADAIATVTDNSFEGDVLRADLPVLVDFWAEWCGPCKMLAPVLEDIVGTYQDRIKIAKVNIDENPESPAKYGVRGIPTLLLFKEGQVVATKVGALSKAQLVAFLDSQI